ncbi:MAG: hypothetical protein ACOC6I_03605 [Candidatus Bipolaricaulota bacterium]
MKKVGVDFIKGHMGGNEIILLNGHQIPEGQERERSAVALNPPSIRGHQAGILYKEESGIRAKVVSVTGLDFISMCGGLTQVLGKALEQGNFANIYEITTQEPTTDVTLFTDAGPIYLTLHIKDGQVAKTETEMNSFLQESYQKGVRPIEVAGVPAYKVGEALCSELDDIKDRFPSVDFEELGTEAYSVFEKIQNNFVERFFPESGIKGKTQGKTFAIYDSHPERSGDIRVIFPHDVSTGHIEPSCGTGTSVVGITMCERDQIPPEGEVELFAESGGDINHIGGPERTMLHMEMKDGKVESISFNHSLVELLAQGTLWV